MKEDIKLGKSEAFTSELQNEPEAGKCPRCGTRLITACGHGISRTLCLKCDYMDYDYDFDQKVVLCF